MKKLILILMLLLLIPFSYSIGIGESANGYTYRYAYKDTFTSDHSTWGTFSMSTCDDTVYFGHQGGVGMVIYQYDINDNEVDDYFPIGSVNNDDHDRVLYANCEDNLLFTIAKAVNNIYLRKWNTTDMFNNYSLPGNNQGREAYGLIDTELLPNDFSNIKSSVSYVIIDDSIFLNTNETIYEFDVTDTGSLTELNSETLTNSILNLATDGVYLYVLTDTNIIKYDSSLIQQTITSDSRLIPETPNIYQYMIYNQYTRYLYIVTNNETIARMDTNLFYQDNVTLDHDYSSINIINDIVYSSNGTTQRACDIVTGVCEDLFLFTTFDNVSSDYGDLSKTINPHIISNGIMYLKGVDNGSNVFFNVITGAFENESDFQDITTINSFVSNTSNSLTNQEISFTINSSHSEDNNYIRHAFDCDTKTNIIYGEDFEFDRIFNNTFDYTNDCNYINTQNTYSIDNEKSLIFGFNGTFNNCTNPFGYEISQTINNKFRYRHMIGHTYQMNYTLVLFDNGNNPFINLTYYYNSNIQAVTIYDNLQDIGILSYSYATPITPIIILSNTVYDSSIFINFDDGTYRVSLKPYDSNDDRFSDDINLTTNSSNMKKYLYYPDVSNAFKSEIFEIEIDNKYIPDYENTTTHTCTYAEPGVYTVRGYATSIFSLNDYNTFSDLQINIYGDFIPSSNISVDEQILVGQSFDELLYVNDTYDVGFWKLMIFLGFTAIILGGLGFMNKKNEMSNPTMFWLEFLLIEGFMLWVMSYGFRFFPLWYFFLYLIIVALTSMYYLNKVFFGGGE